MKQKLFLAAMAAIAMTSCSNDETLEINTGTERAIDFRTAMATRATETTTGDLKEFYVTAFNENIIEAPYFKDVKFFKPENKNLFSSEDTYYYPGDGSKLTFYAYAPSAEKLNASVETVYNETTKEMTLKNFSPAETITDQVDFITANTTGSKDDAVTGVPLEFKHRLSQIEILGVNQQQDTYRFEIKGIRIANAVSKGDFDFMKDKDQWNLSEEEKHIYQYDYETPITVGSLFTSLTKECGGAMLLPQQLTKWNAANDNTNEAKGAYISFFMRITTKDGALVYPFKAEAEKGATHAWAAVPIGTTWEAGKKYRYNMSFHLGAGYVDPNQETSNPGKPILDGEIEFKVTVEDWGASIEHDNLGDNPNEFPDVEIPDENEGEDPFGDE